MALIKCPECGQSVSDKATICIHCGFPLDKINTDNSSKTYSVFLRYTNNPYILIRLLVNTFGIEANEAQKFNKVTGDAIFSGLSKENADFLPNYFLEKASSEIDVTETNKSFDKHINTIIDKLREKSNAPITCPRCGSTQITTGARGVSWTRGLIGASKTVNRCGKCGYVFKPGR